MVRVETIEHYPPDTKAAETWLFNRQPDKWKRQRDADKDPDRELAIKVIGGLPRFTGTSQAMPTYGLGWQACGSRRARRSY